MKPQGWHNWDKKGNEQTAFYAEFNNYGDGASIKDGVPWSHQLTADEANEYTPTNIFAGWNLVSINRTTAQVR